jgi:hypothetical protein
MFYLNDHKFCSQNLISEGDYYTYRRSADVAVVLTPVTKNGNCGLAYTDILEYGKTLGLVVKSCATGYYSFGHEVSILRTI